MNTGRQPLRAGDVIIVAALPDPLGTDRGHESVTVLNTTAASVELTGWRLVDEAGAHHQLTGALAGGAVQQIVLGNGLSLGNSGDTLVLVDVAGGTIDRVSYPPSQVRPGRTICFGR